MHGCMYFWRVVSSANFCYTCW